MTVTRLQLFDPFFVFLAFNSFSQSHDCFECFNRLPGVRYSSFQYTLEERNHNLEIRQGRGAVRNFENLLKDAEAEAEAERNA